MGELRFTVTAWDEGDGLVVRVIRWEPGKVYPDRVPMYTFERTGRTREEVAAGCLRALISALRLVELGR